MAVHDKLSTHLRLEEMLWALCKLQDEITHLNEQEWSRLSEEDERARAEEIGIKKVERGRRIKEIIQEIDRFKGEGYAILYSSLLPSNLRKV